MKEDSEDSTRCKARKIPLVFRACSGGNTKPEGLSQFLSFENRSSKGQRHGRDGRPMKENSVDFTYCRAGKVPKSAALVLEINGWVVLLDREPGGHTPTEIQWLNRKLIEKSKRKCKRSFDSTFPSHCIRIS